MKILFVCQQYIHSARWINQLKESGHEIYVFDCLDRPIHKELEWTNTITNWSKRKVPYIKGEHFFKKKYPRIYNFIEPLLKATPSEKLLKVILKISPDLVHSFEMQSQSYHVLKVRQKLNFKWAYFSWGSDLYFYKNQKRHRKTIKKVLSKINYLFTDNTRDIQLAKNLNYKNEISGVFPGGGGYDLKKYKKFIKPVSERELILVKGYQHWSGRALHILGALEFLQKDIQNLKIYVYSAHDILIKKIKKLNKSPNIQIQYSSRKNEIPQIDLLKKFGNAKISIGNSISDGIPNTLLEGIIMGAFPIQSNPGGVTEDYITDGKNGFLINNPNDEKEIYKHILKAIKNEDLLDSAFEINQNIAKTLELGIIQKKVLKLYQKIEKQL